MAIQFSNESLKKEIESGHFVLVDFYADWCGPCQQMAPIIENISKRYEGRLVTGKIDTMKYPELSGEYRIMAIPVIMLFKNGEMVEKLVGARNEEDLCSYIEKHLS